MRILVLGGTGLTGPCTVRELVAAGHEVILYNRGQSAGPVPEGVARLFGIRSDLRSRSRELRALRADVVLHMTAVRSDETRAFMELFDGFAGRVVGVSSIDVYAAFGRIKGTERGPPQAIPIPEEGELRRTIEPQGEAYEKLGVEREFSSRPGFPAAILRFPAVHGPRDGLRRLYPYRRRMDDGQECILIEETAAAFRISRAFAGNAAAAVVLAVTDARAVGRIYNVAEPEASTEREWIETVGQLAGWKGEIVAMPAEAMPDHLAVNDDLSHHLAVDSFRIRSELGYREPVSRDDGIVAAIDWERANPPAASPTFWPIDPEKEIEALRRFRGRAGRATG